MTWEGPEVVPDPPCSGTVERSRDRARVGFTFAFVMALAWVASSSPTLEAQSSLTQVQVIGSNPSVVESIVLEEPLVETDGLYIVVHLSQNRVYVMDGRQSIWSAPAGTGTGFRLAGAGKRWTFTTPKGLFRVRRKEKDPIWIAPDWYYVEKGWGVPADNDPRRRMPGVMGNTALYLGDGIAIHGTNAPELILNPDPEKRRVSHGCIRLTNESARTLYHLVEVDTPVLVF